jgi:hypothetical protein
VVGTEILERLRTGNGWKSRAEGLAAVRRLRSGGPSPAVVLIGAFAAGFLLAKVIDWRGHAHPRI